MPTVCKRQLSWAAVQDNYQPSCSNTTPTGAAGLLSRGGWFFLGCLGVEEVEKRKKGWFGVDELWLLAGVQLACTMNVFLNHFALYILRQGLSLTQFIDSAWLAGECVPGILRCWDCRYVHCTLSQGCLTSLSYSHLIDRLWLSYLPIYPLLPSFNLSSDPTYSDAM